MKISKVLTLVACIFVSGCGQTFDPQKVQTFGEAAKTLSAAISETRDIQNRLAKETDTEIEAVKYLRENPKFSYPPQPKKTASVSDEWNIRIAFVKALSDYGAALVKVTDASVAANLDTAVDNLRKAVEAANPSLAKEPEFAPAANVATRSAKLLLRYRNANAIMAQIRRAHPAIVAGAALLHEDLDHLAVQADARYKSWLIYKRTTLEEVRDDPLSTMPEQYAAYRLMVADHDQLASAIKLLVPAPGEKPPYIKILDALVKAHAALLDPASDPQAFNELIVAIGDIADLVKATAAPSVTTPAKGS